MEYFFLKTVATLERSVENRGRIGGGAVIRQQTYHRKPYGGSVMACTVATRCISYTRLIY